ncbi:paraquat-inducible protein B-like protein [Pseudomonas aeruginosa PA38182]|nr:paraquat-inducible protein B-like protein [Pseudomonas aeruginosa PA38182]
MRFAKSGAPSREFTIRPKAPPLNTDAPGLHLVLTSDKLGSIDIGAPILYRQVRVGSVQSYQLSRDRQRVVVGVHIECRAVPVFDAAERLPVFDAADW